MVKIINTYYAWVYVICNPKNYGILDAGRKIPALKGITMLVTIQVFSSTDKQYNTNEKDSILHVITASCPRTQGWRHGKA
jgi:hypothetical protein